MFCNKCGNQIKEGAAFCNSCGTPAKSGGENPPLQLPAQDTYTSAVELYTPNAPQTSGAAVPEKVPIQLKMPFWINRRFVSVAVALLVVVVGVISYNSIQENHRLELIAMEQEASEAAEQARLEAERKAAEAAEQARLEAERKEAERVLAEAREGIDETLQTFARAYSNGDFELAGEQFVSGSIGSLGGFAGKVQEVDPTGIVNAIFGGGAYLVGYSYKIKYDLTDIAVVDNTASVEVVVTEDANLREASSYRSTMYLRKVGSKWLIDD
jgi:hypothetical protein